MRGQGLAKRYIKQRKPYDCGVACLAMLLGETYSSIMRATTAYFRRSKKKITEGLNCDDFRAVASAFDETLIIRSCGKTRKRRRDIIKKLCGRPAILYVPALCTDGEYHVIFWDGYNVFDPGNSQPAIRYGKNGARALVKFIYAVTLKDDEKYRAVAP